MVEKTSSRGVLKGIFESLSSGPKSIMDIANETQLDRIAITRYLDSLKESKIVKETEDGRKRVFSLTKIEKRKDTYFGLPLTKEQEELIQSLFILIKTEWKKLTNKQLYKTQVQKILYEINNDCNLDLPIGWYINGGLCVKSYDDTVDYKDFGLRQNIIDCAKIVIEKVSNHKHAYDSKNSHYKKEDKKLYLLKEQILSHLYSQKFSKKSGFYLNKFIRELVNMAPKDYDGKYYQILEEYQDLIFQYFNNLDDKKIIELQQDLTKSFENIWKLIALHNYRNDLSEFYDESTLEAYMIHDILSQEKETIDSCSELQEKIPTDKDIDSENYKKIKDSLKNVKKSKENIDDKTDSFSKFGL